MTTAPNIRDCDKQFIRDTLDEVRNPFEVAIMGSTNYFNSAAIIRTAHCFLARKIWLVDCEQFYKKGTMGTHKWEHIAKVSMERFLEETSGRNYVAFERRSDLPSADLRSFRYPEHPIMVFGSEKLGMPSAVLERAHSIVSIQMWGLHNDLNLSTASGIAMFDFVNKMINVNRTI